MNKQVGNRPGRPLKHGEPTVRVTAHLPKSVRDELWRAAKASGVSVSEFINIAVTWAIRTAPDGDWEVEAQAAITAHLSHLESKGMRERIAQTLFQTDPSAPLCTWESMSKRYSKKYYLQADAVHAAMISVAEGEE